MIKTFKVLPRGGGKTTLATKLHEQLPNSKLLSGSPHSWEQIFNTSILNSTPYKPIIIDEVLACSDSTLLWIIENMNRFEFHLFGTWTRPLEVYPKPFMDYILQHFPEELI